MGSSKPRLPPPPGPSDAEVEEERRKQLKARNAQAGRQSTILTGPQGVGTRGTATMVGTT